MERRSHMLNGHAGISELIDAPGRVAEGLTVAIEWETLNGEAPAAPARHLQQYGVVRSAVYCRGFDILEDGQKIAVERTGKTYVKKSQAKYADYILRKHAGAYVVTSKPMPGNENIVPDGMGDSWGKPTRARGFTGMLEDAFAGFLGYRFQRKSGGSFRFPAISGMVTPKPKKRRERKRRERKRR